ncbi:hypothetical protein [Desmospora activa]|uniref:Lipoprotein n=1 Tax=Desmospora activa DSM 45169 TaxID=1121389 RepID=A0A2T4YYX0_9BACL|nr:hypothetical protein [Desmospora activa]PTM52181.1 hypothetical protein C8J48_3728 [Desmospora activa DSM 45169]
MNRIAVILLLFALILAGCQSGDGKTASPKEKGPETIDGVSPRDLPVIVAEALPQQDGKTLDRFIVDEDKDRLREHYDLDKGPHGIKEDFKIDPDYRLVEYRANDDLYYYRLEYPGQSKAVSTDYYKVFRTDEGWKTYYYYSKPKWEYETQDLEPNVVKGVHDQP